MEKAPPKEHLMQQVVPLAPSCLLFLLKIICSEKGTNMNDASLIH